jgi:aminoglycoside phosphotransferase (APT) family kinase protein
MRDIKDYDTFLKIQQINKGMSSDKKYYIETAGGQRLLLRIADISEYERKKAEFDIMKKAVMLGIPMPQPFDFGICDSGKSVYTLLTWIDGKEVETILPGLTESEQYSLGVKSGEILLKIHTIPVPENADDWAARYFSVIDKRLAAFRSEGVPFDGDATILDFIESNRCLLKNRPQCRHHGDYHEGNMIISESGELSIIDWHTVDFDNYGDPWYEFNRIGTVFPAFASGQIDGYFHGKPPKEFWTLLAYYLAASAITSIVWAKYFAPERLNAILQLNVDVLHWFDNMENPVPTWYLKERNGICRC